MVSGEVIALVVAGLRHVAEDAGLCETASFGVRVGIEKILAIITGCVVVTGYAAISRCELARRRTFNIGESAVVKRPRHVPLRADLGATRSVSIRAGCCHVEVPHIVPRFRDLRDLWRSRNLATCDKLPLVRKRHGFFALARHIERLSGLQSPRIAEFARPFGMEIVTLPRRFHILPPNFTLPGVVGISARLHVQSLPFSRFHSVVFAAGEGVGEG